MKSPPAPHHVIAIDGPAGAGKSTAAQRLASLLGYYYVDSGALYRAVGWLASTLALPPDDVSALAAALEHTALGMVLRDGVAGVWMQGQCVTSQLRGEVISHAASTLATLPLVRQSVTAKLRALRHEADLVMDGRDIGTVVFPDATVKFFLEASLAVRGQRRLHEMQQRGQIATLEQVVEGIARRDAQDRTRAIAPLRPAPEAYAIDTTNLTVDDVVQTMLSEIQRVLARKPR